MTALTYNPDRAKGLDMNSDLILVFAGTLVLGIVFLSWPLVVLYQRRRYWEFAHTASSATALVTDVREVERSIQHGEYARSLQKFRYPMVKFETRDGRIVEKELPAEEVEVGQERTVLYDPLDPEEARLASPASSPVGSFLQGAFLGCIMLFGFVVAATSLLILILTAA